MIICLFTDDQKLIITLFEKYFNNRANLLLSTWKKYLTITSLSRSFVHKMQKMYVIILIEVSLGEY